MINHVIIGSRAMKHHFPDFPREPNDTDVVIRSEDFATLYHEGRMNGDIETYSFGKAEKSCIIKWKGIPHTVEYLFADEDESLSQLLRASTSQYDYAPVEILYSIKKAHINYPIKFDKHIKDFMFLREKLRERFGISLETDLSSHIDWLDQMPCFTAIHKKCTEARLGKVKTPKMDTKTEDFFGKSKKYVTSYFVHDDMHKAIAKMHEGDPVYEKIIAEGSEVETDLILWSKLTLQQKIWCVLEEVYVIALERKVIPPLFGGYDSEFDAKQAFDWALFRVCTTLCDGFFRDFAVKAYDEIQKQYNSEYVELFFKNIRQYDTNYEETEEVEGCSSGVADSDATPKTEV